MLRCIYILRKLATELLLARVRLLAGHRLLLLVQLLVEGVVARAHGLLDDHAAGVARSGLLLPQRRGIHLAARPPRVNRMLFDDLIEHPIRRPLDHCAVAVIWNSRRRGL